jgi:NTE family protein
MPFGKEPMEPGVGLALSGGGFRAVLFHAGALWRVNEMGLLPSLDRISSVSGGSIVAGLLSVRWGALNFRNDIAQGFRSEIIDPLRRFCSRNVDLRAILGGIFLPWRSASQRVQKAYEDDLLGNATLQGLPDRPCFVFNATNFATGVSFRFSKPYAGDYRIGLIRNPEFRVSLAVAASSAFPPFLSPTRADTDPGAFEKVDGADLFDAIEYRKSVRLTDGGVYDNLGLQTVWDRYVSVLVSDAGAPFDPKPAISCWPGKQVLRTLNIATNQSRALRKLALVADLKSGKRRGAYWGIGTRIGEYELPDALPVHESRSAELAAMRTRLDRFTESEQCQLINIGYALGDAAIRKHYGVPGTMPPPRWPYPDYALDRT